MAAPTGGTPMPEHEATAGQAPECLTCPICSTVAALREARPEAVEHLLKAGAELLLAAKVLLDGAHPSGTGGAAGLASDGLQRIDIG
jgi:hypothetical protein